MHVRPLRPAIAPTMRPLETDNGILLTPYDPRFEAVMAACAEGAGLFRNALREFAK